MLLARILCAIGLILGLFMIICPVRVFKMRNTIRSIFMINELGVGDFKIIIYRAGGIFEILIFTLLLTQTFTI
ncbi:hypothetical protein G9F72_010145 [Clostridium estertheticum]|uniref:hypothetical protein n=1 Tax=Clostridium estertheticum TaxID=238834 RepID=UPI0013E96ED7|nr:hypothetical protein [Clostridium estertheticum]MBZ9686684.1 hypothetical protein [Clostridium estertheticum]